MAPLDLPTILNTMTSRFSDESWRAAVYGWGLLTEYGLVEMGFFTNVFWLH